jgi:predicted esterase YcpF (UPF0227 family)
MNATTIIYLHGFNSSPQSVKGRAIARVAAALPDPPRFHLPALAQHPEQAMREVCAWIDSAGVDRANLALIGSSLGGFYATWLAERYGARAVVINPAIRPAADLRPFVGRQRNPHTGVEYDVTPAHFVELALLEVARITQAERYFLLVRTGDELLDWRVASAFYAGAFQYVAGGGDHGWEDFAAEIASVLGFCMKPASAAPVGAPK